MSLSHDYYRTIIPFFCYHADHQSPIRSDREPMANATLEPDTPDTPSHCRLCGAALPADYGDELCQTCFLTSGMETIVELASSQAQQTLVETLILLSHQAHQRAQTDTAYHALVAAYHAAYTPDHLATIIQEAQKRADEWKSMLDECGSVRASTYQQLVAEAQLLQHDVTAALQEP